MSADSIDYSLAETAVEGHDGDVEGDTGRVDRTASLRRSFTPYEPRHRADGPAV